MLPFFFIKFTCTVQPKAIENFARIMCFKNWLLDLRLLETFLAHLVEILVNFKSDIHVKPFDTYSFFVLKYLEMFQLFQKKFVI